LSGTLYWYPDRHRRFLFEALGQWEGFLILAAASAIATALLWAAMPETNLAKYLD
jgi:hypothetical protein